MPFGIVDEENLLRFDRSPRDGFLKDAEVRFFEAHLKGENPFVKNSNNGKGRQDVVEVKRIGVGEEPESPSSL